jgi:hypothetical protein
MKFLHLAADASPLAATSSASETLQFFVDLIHGYVAWNAYVALGFGLLGVGWLGLILGTVVAFLHALAVLELRDRGYDPTHIDTARRAIKTMAGRAKELHSVAY